MRGFTLVELLLSVAVIGILTAGVLGFSLFLLRSNDMELALSATAQTLRRAQTLARSGQHDGAWGVKLQSETITIFHGNSYANRDSSLDEVTDLPSTIAVSGLTEVTYAAATGTPSSAGVTTLTHETLGARRLFLNTIGTIDEVGSGQTVSLTAMRDATLIQSSPGTNDGTSAQIQEYPRNNGHNKRFTLWFNLSTIPTGAQINSAMLKLSEAQTYGVPRTVAVHRVTQSWGESTATWDSLASSFNPTASAGSTIAWTGLLKWDQWDVTADVQAFLSGSAQNYGWLVKDAQEDLSEAYWYFSSREGANAPVLEVTYTL